MTPFDLLLIALATLYASYALTKSDGPFHVFATIRARLPLGGLTTCIVCASFWLALAFVLLWLFAPLVVDVFAAAGAAVFLAQYVGLKQE